MDPDIVVNGNPVGNRCPVIFSDQDTVSLHKIYIAYPLRGPVSFSGAAGHNGRLKFDPAVDVIIHGLVGHIYFDIGITDIVAAFAIASLTVDSLRLVAFFIF